jgi:hypothetical protein
MCKKKNFFIYLIQNNSPLSLTFSYYSNKVLGKVQEVLNIARVMKEQLLVTQAKQN